MELVKDPVQGPRRRIKVGRYQFAYYGTCVEDANNPRFVYRVSLFTDDLAFSDAWIALFREDFGGFGLVGFVEGVPPPYLPMGSIGRDSIASKCVP